MIDEPLTALANGMAAGYFLFAVIAAVWLRRVHGYAEVRESALWAMLPSVCWYAHRTLWNVAIVTDTAATPGPYAAWSLETRHWWTLVLFVLAIYGGWRVVRPWLPGRLRRRAGWWLSVSIVAHGAAWAAVVWFFQAQE